MESYDVLRKAIDSIGVKAVAARLRLSQALVYKWCQPPEDGDTDGSGTRNPLDRVAEIIEATSDVDPARWICGRANGFFVANAPARTDNVGTALVVNTQHLVREFSELLMAVTRSIEDDGEIEVKEASHIRDEWEQFKGTVEAFVIACERGMFLKRHRKPPESR